MTRLVTTLVNHARPVPRSRLMIEFPQHGDEIELHYPVNTQVRIVADDLRRLG